MFPVTAIDTHTHINHGSKYDSTETPIYSAMPDALFRINDAAGIHKMLCSTFSSVLNTEEVEAENEYLFELAQQHERLYQWVVIDPRNGRTFEQARRMLRRGKCVGVKIHPSNHKYAYDEVGDKLFGFIADHQTIVQIHPNHPCTLILPYADKYPDATFIMAHLGEVAYVDAIEQAKHGNVWADTSGIASSRNQILEYAVGRVGSERILFGTDTYAAGFQRGRVEYAQISGKDKENILRNNAVRLFGSLIGE